MKYSSQKKARIVILSIIGLFCFINLNARIKKSPVFLEYIECYSDLAVKHQNKYRIPASITLAQGILESGAGRSSFVKESNNHFGIKCHRSWTGKTIYRTDDRPNECFRKYKKAEDSFEDHSLFLVDNTRYEILFTYEITDYKSWARGLQTSGYATDKAYANKLIKLIEDYELYRYDKKGKRSKPSPVIQLSRDIYKTHGLIYVIADAGDGLDDIADDLGFKVKDLIKYNEIPEDFPLNRGDIIYLEKKKKKADKPYYDHVVRIGESMHSISQRYGIQLERLYKMNKKSPDYVPEEGDVLKLR